MTSTRELSKLLDERPEPERYQDRMAAGKPEKVSQIEEALAPYYTRKSIGVSIGAGTGSVERAIQENLRVHGGQLIAVDLSTPMLEALSKGSDTDERRLHAVKADAVMFPFADGSVDFVYAGSLIHEIASYKDGKTFGTNVQEFLQEVAHVLRPGGRLIIRDFMQPEHSDHVVALRLGSHPVASGDSQFEFLSKFVTQFDGLPLVSVRRQVEAMARMQPEQRIGQRILLTLDEAVEILAHASWASSFAQEVDERYAFMRIQDYAAYVQAQFREAGFSTHVVETSLHVQPGYQLNLKGILSLENPYAGENKRIDIPAFTGVVVIEKSLEPTNSIRSVNRRRRYE